MVMGCETERGDRERADAEPAKAELRLSRPVLGSVDQDTQHRREPLPTSGGGNAALVHLSGNLAEREALSLISLDERERRQRERIGLELLCLMTLHASRLQALEVAEFPPALPGNVKGFTCAVCDALAFLFSQDHSDM